MHFVAFTAATEAQRLAEAAGLDLVELGEVVRHTDAITGGPGAIMHRRHDGADRRRTTSGTASSSTSRALGEKDLTFAIALADELDVDVPMATAKRWRPASDKATRDCDGASSTTCRSSGARGLEKMEEVYGFDMTDGAGDFFGYTADHLFADIWNRPGLSDRDRRLLLIGMLAGRARHDVLTIQIPAAYAARRARRRAAARDRDLPVPLRRLAERRPAQLDRRGDHRQGGKGRGEGTPRRADSGRDDVLLHPVVARGHPGPVLLAAVDELGRLGVEPLEECRQLLAGLLALRSEVGAVEDVASAAAPA